jgi:hypothetical protein
VRPTLGALLFLVLLSSAAHTRSRGVDYSTVIGVKGPLVILDNVKVPFFLPPLSLSLYLSLSLSLYIYIYTRRVIREASDSLLCFAATV